MKERNPLQTVLRFIEENINQKGIFFRDSSHKRVMKIRRIFHDLICGRYFELLSLLSGESNLFENAHARILNSLIDARRG